MRKPFPSPNSFIRQSHFAVKFSPHIHQVIVNLNFRFKAVLVEFKIEFSNWGKNISSSVQHSSYRVPWQNGRMK